MKILYIVSLFPCWSETFIVREIYALKKKGVDVAILSLKNTAEEIIQTDTQELSSSVIYPSPKVLLSLKALVTFLKRPFTNTKILLSIITSLRSRPGSLLKSIATWWITLGMTSDVNKLNIDHIHAHWATYPSTSALILSKNTDRPFSFTSHAHDIFLEDHLLKEKITESKFSVTISDYNKNRLSSQLSIDLDSKMNVVHCAIDVNRHVFSTSNRSSNTILAVGRLDHIKGFSVLIDACNEYKNMGGEFECIIIGNGPLKEQLQKQINDYKLSDHIRLVGVMPQEKIKEYLLNATLFVLPSVVTQKGDMDGIPVALMEAMAAGAPVISTNVSGIPELINNNINGLIVEPNNPHQLAAAISELLNNVDLRQKFSSAARHSIESDFSIDKEVDKLYSLFNNSSISVSEYK